MCLSISLLASTLLLSDRAADWRCNARILLRLRGRGRGRSIQPRRHMVSSLGGGSLIDDLLRTVDLPDGLHRIYLALRQRSFVNVSASRVGQVYCWGICTMAGAGGAKVHLGRMRPSGVPLLFFLPLCPADDVDLALYDDPIEPAVVDQVGRLGALVGVQSQHRLQEGG